jgi:hypothetical protein
MQPQEGDSMSTATQEPQSRTIQTWPAGKMFTYRGDGDKLEVQGEKSRRWRKATSEERKLIETEERATRIREQEVFCCDSCLVDELMKHGEELPGDLAAEWSWEQVENLRPDPSEWGVRECSTWLEDEGHTGDAPDANPFAFTRAQLVEWLTENGTGIPQEDCPNDTDDAGLRELMIARMDDADGSDLREWRDAVRDNANDAEVFEWWRVSRWLCEKLREAGYVVLDNEYGYWWGRTTTGQSMEMDGVFQKIAASL